MSALPESKPIVDGDTTCKNCDHTKDAHDDEVGCVICGCRWFR